MSEKFINEQYILYYCGVLHTLMLLSTSSQSVEVCDEHWTPSDPVYSQISISATDQLLSSVQGW